MKDRVTERNGSHNRKWCDCGQPAVVMLGNAKICQSCYDKDAGNRYHDEFRSRPQLEHVYSCNLVKFQ